MVEVILAPLVVGSFLLWVFALFIAGFITGAFSFDVFGKWSLAAVVGIVVCIFFVDPSMKWSLGVFIAGFVVGALFVDSHMRRQK